jgi:hypothetical protein
MHRLRSAADSAKLMIEGSQIQLQNVNTLNPDSILSQPASQQPAASQPESKCHISTMMVHGTLPALSPDGGAVAKVAQTVLTS